MSENQSLFDLNKALSVVTYQIEQNEGAITPEVEKALEELLGKVADKVDGYGAILDRIEATADYWKSQADKCKTVEKSLDNLAASLKNNLKTYMITNQQKELAATHHKFVLSASKEKLVIENEKLIPEEFKTQVISYELNKDKISECLRVGQVVPGAKLEGGFSLRKYLNRGI